MVSSRKRGVTPRKCQVSRARRKGGRTGWLERKPFPVDEVQNAGAVVDGRNRNKFTNLVRISTAFIEIPQISLQ